MKEPLPPMDSSSVSPATPPATPVERSSALQDLSAQPPIAPARRRHWPLRLVWILIGLMLVYGVVLVPASEVPLLALTALCAGVFWSVVILLIDRFLHRHTPELWYPVPILSRWFAPSLCYRLLWVAFALLLALRELPFGRMFDFSLFYSTSSFRLATRDSFHRTSSPDQNVQLAKLPLECTAHCVDSEDFICQLVSQHMCPAGPTEGERVQMRIRLEIETPFCFVPLLKLRDTDFHATISLSHAESGTEVEHVAKGSVGLNAFGSISCRAYRERAAALVLQTIARQADQVLARN